jgi:hypothetical protein
LPRAATFEQEPLRDVIQVRIVGRNQRIKIESPFLPLIKTCGEILPRRFKHFKHDIVLQVRCEVNHLIPEKMGAVEDSEGVDCGPSAHSSTAVEPLPSRQRALQPRETTVRSNVSPPRPREHVLDAL